MTQRFDQNHARSTLSMFRGGSLPVPAGLEDLRTRDIVSATMLAFSRGQSFNPLLGGRTRGTCSDIAGGISFQNRSCYKTPAIPLGCIYCTDGGVGQTPVADCAVTAVHDAVDERQLCTGLRTAAPPTHPVSAGNTPPTIQMHYPNDGLSTDAEGSSESFQVHAPALGRSAALRYFLRPSGLFYVPCRVGAYCSVLEGEAVWIANYFLYNAGDRAGWTMRCTRTIRSIFGNAYQLAPRELFLPLSFTGARAMTMVRFAVGCRKQCFWLNDTFTFTEGCHLLSDELRWWECVGSTGGGFGLDVVAAIGNGEADPELPPSKRGNGMYLIADPQINTTNIEDGGLYPHARTDDIAIKNICWAAVARALDSIYDTREEAASLPQLPGEGRPDARNLRHQGGRFDAAGISRWSISTDDPHGVIGFIMTDRGFFNDSITLYEPLLDLHVPAELTIQSLVGDIIINVETRLLGGALTPSHRAFGAINLVLRVRPKISPLSRSVAAAAGLTFMDQDDDFETRIASPADPSVEHSHYKFLATGPDGGHIPYVMEWDGLLADPPYSVTPKIAYVGHCDPTNQFGSYQSACDTLHTMARTVIFGEVNSHADPTPEAQLLGGSCGFGVPGIADANGQTPQGPLLQVCNLQNC